MWYPINRYGVFKKTIIAYIVVDSMPLLWGILINKNIFYIWMLFEETHGA